MQVVVAEAEEKGAGALAQHIIRSHLTEFPGHTANKLQHGVAPLPRAHDDATGLCSCFQSLAGAVSGRRFRACGHCGPSPSWRLGNGVLCVGQRGGMGGGCCGGGVP